MALTPEQRLEFLKRKQELLTRKRELMLQKSEFNKPEELPEIEKPVTAEIFAAPTLPTTPEQIEDIQRGRAERKEKLELGEFDETETFGEDVVKSVALAEQGFRQGTSGIKEIVSAFNPNADLDLTQRAEEAFAGVVDIISGGVGVATSPLPAILPNIVEQPLTKVAAFLGSMGDAGIANLIEFTGGDPNSKTALKTREMASILAQFLGFKAGAKVVSTGVSKIKQPVGEFLQKGAEKQLERVLEPTKEKFKVKTAKILPELVEEKPLALTRKGLLKQSKEKLRETGKEIEKFIDEKGIEGSTEISKLTNVLEEAKQEFKVGKIEVEPETIRVIEGIQEVLVEFGEKIPNTELRNLAQIWNKSIAKKGRFDVNKTPEVLAEVDFKGMVTESIRAELAKTNPELAKINKKYSFYKNLTDVLEATEQRTVGQKGGLISSIWAAAGFGGAISSGFLNASLTAAGVAAIVSLFKSTAYRTLSASVKKSLSDAILKNDKSQLRSTISEINKKVPIELKIPIQKDSTE